MERVPPTDHEAKVAMKRAVEGNYVDVIVTCPDGKESTFKVPEASEVVVLKLLFLKENPDLGIEKNVRLLTFTMEGSPLMDPLSLCDCKGFDSTKPMRISATF